MRMLRLRRSLRAITSVLLLAGCAPSLFPTEMPVTASLSDSGGTASLVPYQPLVVRLQSNPSTGYGWSYTVSGDEVLRLDSVSGEAPAPNGMVVPRSGVGPRCADLCVCASVGKGYRSRENIYADGRS